MDSNAEIGDVVGFDDGLYRCSTPLITAGFVVRDNRLVAIAPVLRKRFHGYWELGARRIGPDPLCPACLGAMGHKGLGHAWSICVACNGTGRAS